VPAFKLGDVVILKSGGPLMTVEALGHQTYSSLPDPVKCVWFVEKKKEVAIFPAAALRAAADTDLAGAL